MSKELPCGCRAGWTCDRHENELRVEVFTQNRDAETAKEAIDVANFAMMIADVCDPLPDDTEVRHRPAAESKP